MRNYDVVVIGGGPAGLSAAQSACLKGGKVAIIEREARLGGILKQCVHDGFGLIRFGEKLAGPEYSERYIDFVRELDIDTFTFTFVTRIEKKDGGFEITAVSKDGIEKFFAKALVLATGCRERTAKQVLIQGTRPAGVFTAGTAQNFVNLQGKLPTKSALFWAAATSDLSWQDVLLSKAQQSRAFTKSSPRRADLRETYISACTISTYLFTYLTPLLECSARTGSKRLRLQR